MFSFSFLWPVFFSNYIRAKKLPSHPLSHNSFMVGVYSLRQKDWVLSRYKVWFSPDDIKLGSSLDWFSINLIRIFHMINLLEFLRFTQTSWVFQALKVYETSNVLSSFLSTSTFTSSTRFSGLPTMMTYPTAKCSLVTNKNILPNNTAEYHR